MAAESENYVPDSYELELSLECSDLSRKDNPTKAWLMIVVLIYIVCTLFMSLIYMAKYDFTLLESILTGLLSGFVLAMPCWIIGMRLIKE